MIDANLPRHISVWTGSSYSFVIDIGPELREIEIWNYAAA